MELTKRKLKNERIFEDGEKPYVHTLEGNMYVSNGDFIIKGLRDEFYPCKPDIFTKTYDIAK